MRKIRFALCDTAAAGLGQAGAWVKSALQLYNSNTLFWMQGSSRAEIPVWAASLLRGPARRSAFVIDAWPSVYAKIGWLAVLQRLNPLFIPYKQAQVALTQAFPRGKFEWLPFGIDADVFKPRDVEKDIFIYWMGRRYEPLHRAILAYCAARGLKYVYSVPGGEFPKGHALGTLVSRARYFVVTSPNLDNPARTGNISPMGLRYMEGLAAGTRLLGVLPASGEYQELLPLDAILQVSPDGSDLAEKLAGDIENPEAVRAVSRASLRVRSLHSWDRRAEQILARLRED